MFGGKNYRYRPLDKTQTIAGSQVTLVTTEGPSARHSLSLTYDSHRDQIMLYGGKTYQEDLQVPLPLSDLWCWDGEQWRCIQNS